MLFSSVDTPFAFDGPVGKLQALLRAGDPDVYQDDLIAVICHPHPLYQGTMKNKVVTTLARCCRERGIDHVRFNFRGVEDSEGEFGNLEGEIEDLKSVVAQVCQAFPNRRLVLSGFSFGSAVAANASLQLQGVAHLALVAPPVGKYDLAFPDRIVAPSVLIQGDKDDVVDPLKSIQWGNAIDEVEVVVLEGAEHFFHGRLVELANLYKQALAKAGI